jgi:signal transduction histidine kinase
MNITKRTNHPFRLLLYVEWVLLSMTVIAEVPWESVLSFITWSLPPSPSQKIPFAWQITFICIIIFGLLGLRLPKSSNKQKWLYTALEFGLIYLADWLGGWSRLYAPYLVIIIRSCIIFDNSKRYIVAVIAIVSYLFSLIKSLSNVNLIQEQWSMPVPSTEQLRLEVTFITITSSFYFSLSIIFIFILVNALISEHQSRQKLALAHEQLRQYSLRIEDQAILQERNYIAREIHDSLGHTLTAQRIQLENALLFYRTEPDKTYNYINGAMQLTVMAIKEIRQSVSKLRSNPLQSEDLESALSLLVKDFSQRSNISLDYTIDISHPLTVDINTAVFRIIQEALTNISKYSTAQQVIINIHSRPGNLYLYIEDNGKGFNPEQNTTGFGIQGMRERATTLGGTFYVDSSPDRGCKIQVNIPLITSLIEE